MDWNLPLDIPEPTPETGKRGRPRLGLLDRARASFWARSVQKSAGISFAAIERELSPSSVKARPGGGYEQPHAWNKYAKGIRAPLPPTHGDASPVFRAEKKYPGTAAAYSSLTWDLLYPEESGPPEPMRLSSKFAPYVKEKIKKLDVVAQDPYRILLTEESIGTASMIGHIDALGLLLMQWRNGASKRYSESLVFHTRNWLILAFELHHPIPDCRNQLIALIEEHVPELGVLDGPGGLSREKNTDQRKIDARSACLLSGHDFYL